MQRNPFEVTKAVDFTDEEIESRYINFSDTPYSLLDPRSQVSQYLVGGKGGGRTHLLRHYAYQLQRERADGTVLDQIAREGYLGIYLVASGLNGSRFSGQEVPENQWRAVFANYFELWLCEQLLATLVDIQVRDNCWTRDDQSIFAAAIQRVVSQSDDWPNIAPTDIRAAATSVERLRRDIDAAINNLAFSSDLNVRIFFNPGDLLSDASSAAASLPGMAGITLTYMIDELENFTADQQRFINTLLREKRLPTTFLLGAREWGVRTFETLSAGEINRRGSEFEWIVPEDAYRDSDASYSSFCSQMVTRRLRQDGLDEYSAQLWLDKLTPPDSGALYSDQLLDVMGSAESTDRRYMKRLHRLVSDASGDRTFGNRAVKRLSFAEAPLLEKLAILRLYQTWSRARVLDEQSVEAARAYVLPLLEGGGSDELTNYLNLWRQDLVAQIYADYKRDLPYGGFAQLVEMSGFLPRSLLVTLRYITRLATWRGEGPFQPGGSVSLPTQSAAVIEASTWYLDDVRPLGARGEQCNRAVRRLGQLLRSVRYSDKPSEVSVTSFSSSMHGVSSSTLDVIEDCVKHRMLIEVDGGRTARNVSGVHRKFQLHPMIAPFFGLSFGRRGDLTLSGRDVSAIFDPMSDDSSFSAFAKRRVLPMNAPFRQVSGETLF